MKIKDALLISIVVVYGIAYAIDYFCNGCLQ